MLLAATRAPASRRQGRERERSRACRHVGPGPISASVRVSLRVSPRQLISASARLLVSQARSAGAGVVGSRAAISHTNRLRKSGRIQGRSLVGSRAVHSVRGGIAPTGRVAAHRGCSQTLRRRCRRRRRRRRRDAVSRRLCLFTAGNRGQLGYSRAAGFSCRQCSSCRAALHAAVLRGMSARAALVAPLLELRWGVRSLGRRAPVMHSGRRSQGGPCCWCTRARLLHGFKSSPCGRLRSESIGRLRSESIGRLRSESIARLRSESIARRRSESVGRLGSESRWPPGLRSARAAFAF